LPPEQERFGIGPATADLERAEILVPVTVRHFRARLDPQAKFGEGFIGFPPCDCLLHRYLNGNSAPVGIDSGHEVFERLEGLRWGVRVEWNGILSHRRPRKISLAPAITYRTFRPPFPKSRATLKPSDDSGHPESSVLFLKRSTLWTLVTSRQSDPINQLPRNWLRFVIFLFAPGALHGPSPPNATPDLPNEPISHLFSAQLSPNSSPAPPTRVSRRLSKTNPIPSFFSTTPHRTPALP